MTAEEGEQKPVGRHEQPYEQEREQNVMTDRIDRTDTATSTEQQPLPDESQRSVYRSARKRRVAHFMQMLAAVLVVGLLLSGFLLLLSGRHPRPGAPSTGEADKTPSIVDLTSSALTLFTIPATDGA